MQQTLYPYLPEGMRNPQTFEWMLSNPEYRAQLEQMLESQVGLCRCLMTAVPCCEVEHACCTTISCLCSCSEH